MKKIGIIGANSYIARNLICVLKQRNEYELKLYDLADNYVDGNANYSKINIMDKKDVCKIDFESDALFLFVGKTGSLNGFAEYDAFIDINEKALLNILNEYVNRKSQAKIIFPSTRLVYKGKMGELTEDSEKEFKTIYAMNKYSCEQYLQMYNRMYNVTYCIFRICVPYGTLIKGAISYGTAEFMLDKALKSNNITIYGEGDQRRTLTYIQDLCEILIWGACSDKCVNDVYNVGGENYSLKEMATLIAEKYNVSIDYIEWPENSLKIESGDTVFSSKKLDDIMGEFQVKYANKFAEWVSTCQ